MRNDDLFAEGSDSSTGTGLVLGMLVIGGLVSLVVLFGG